MNNALHKDAKKTCRVRHTGVEGNLNIKEWRVCRYVHSWALFSTTLPWYKPRPVMTRHPVHRCDKIDFKQTDKCITFVNLFLQPPFCCCKYNGPVKKHCRTSLRKAGCTIIYKHRTSGSFEVFQHVRSCQRQFAWVRLLLAISCSKSSICRWQMSQRCSSSGASFD